MLTFPRHKLLPAVACDHCGVTVQLPGPFAPLPAGWRKQMAARPARTLHFCPACAPRYENRKPA